MEPRLTKKDGIERASAAALLATAIVGFAVSWKAFPVLTLLLPVTSSLWLRPAHVPRWLARWACTLLYVALGGTVVLGWILMAYPVLSTESAEGLCVILGSLLSALGALFLIGTRVWRPAAALFPATVGVLVIASFAAEARLVPYLLVAGISAFVYLLWADTGSSSRASMRRSWFPPVVTAGAVLVMASFIMAFLPWAQDRIENVILRLYIDPQVGFTGNEASARLGELGALKRSRRIVFRVWSTRPQKLRAQVYTQFDGKSWRLGRAANSRAVHGLADTPWPAPMLERNGAIGRWLAEVPGRLFVVPNVSPGARDPEKIIHTRVLDRGSDPIHLFAPAGAILVRARADYLRIDDAGIVAPPSTEAVGLYGFVGSPDPLPEKNPERLTEALALPEKVDRRFVELASRLSSGALSPEERLRRTVALVERQARYSLEPGAFETGDPLAEFFFEKKSGYCEYFASAAALLLRLQGVPARFVTGYNVVDTNRVGGHYVVRESDAHAWVEAYVSGKGWVEADPTPAAEYEALHADLGNGWLDATIERIRTAWAELSIRLRDGDWRAVLDELAKTLGGLLYTALVKRPVVSAALALGIAVLMIFRLRLPWTLWLDRSRRHAGTEDGLLPELRLQMARLDEVWARAGVPRPSSRAPLEHLESMPSGTLDPELRESSYRLIELYYRAAFRGDTVSASELRASTGRLE